MIMLDGKLSMTKMKKEWDHAAPGVARGQAPRAVGIVRTNPYSVIRSAENRSWCGVARTERD